MRCFADEYYKYGGPPGDPNLLPPQVQDSALSILRSAGDVQAALVRAALRSGGAADPRVESCCSRSY